MSKPRPPFPLISIVVPGLNEATRLMGLRRAIDDALRPLGARWTFILVDDGSTDDTVAVWSAMMDA
ncbi:MAG TPA: glycosyltransferase, partial [Planctomycetota bacterium]|nr:glycosyltransferase [Planctomycetota bacterium]